MGVAGCGTLRSVSTGFGTELRRRRELRRLSRARLSAMSGVSESQIGNLEVRDVQPQRTTVIDVAGVLGWPVDDALGAARLKPLRADEREMLALRNNTGGPSPQGNIRGDLKSVVDELSEARVVALYYVALAMSDPQALIPPPGGETPTGGSRGDDAIVMDASTGAAERRRQRLRREPEGRPASSGDQP